MRRRVWLFAAVLLTALSMLGAWASAGTAHPAAGAAPAIAAAPATGARVQDDEMTYHNGDVLLHNTVYIVWWDGGVGFASGGDQTAFENRAEDFLIRLQGTTYYHILSQYYMTDANGNKQFIGPYTTFGGSYTDFTPPANNPLGTSDIADEVVKAETAKNWPAGPSSIVVVFVPTGYNVCVSGTGCSPDAFCGFHFDSQTAGDGGSIIKTPYVVIPAPSQNLSKCGAQYFWPADPAHDFPDDLWVQSKSGDASINAMSHEIFEVITDPFPHETDSLGHPKNGWWNDGDGNTLG